MILTTLLLLAVSAPDKVTMEHRAAPVATIVAKLGEQCGIRLDVEQSLRSQSLLVKLTEMPVDRALALVAETTGGVWVDSGTGRVLREDRTAAKRSDEVQRKALIAELDRIVGESRTYKPLSAKDAEAMVKAAKDRDEGNQERQWEDYEKNSNLTPARRLLKRTLAIVGTRVLSSIFDQKRVVFSTSPTRTQRLLPPQAWDAYTTFVSEAAVHSEALESVLPKQEDHGYYNPVLDPSWTPRDRPKALMLVCSRSEFATDFELSLSAVGQTSVTQITQCTFDPSGLQKAMQTPKPLVTGLEGDVVFSEFSRQTLEALGPYLGGRGAGTPEGRAWIRRELERLPESEITTSIVSDLILQGLSQKKLDAVVSVPDFAFALGAQAKRDGKAARLQTAWDMLFGTGVMDATVTDGVLRARISDALPTFRSLPKGAVAKLCRSMSRKGNEMDALADYCLGCHDELEAMYGIMIAQFGYTRLRDMAPRVSGSFRLLRIFARLDSVGKAAVRSGGAKIALASLNQAGREDLRVLLFEDEPKITSNPDPADGADRPYLVEIREPTIRLPDGLPTVGELTLSLNGKASLFRSRTWQDNEATATVDPVEPGAVAFDIAYQERAGANGGASKYANGTMQVLTLISRFGPQTVHTATLRLMPEFEPGDLTAWDKLPEDQRKAIADALPNARKAYEGYKPGAQAGRIKPQA